jgi:hypothetical protein
VFKTVRHICPSVIFKIKEPYPSGAFISVPLINQCPCI